MRWPCRLGVIAARICQGRSTPSEPSVTAMPPSLGRVTLRSMLVNVHCLPLRSSSTVRLPPLRPISVRSRPSRAPASRLSIQASSAARSGTPPRMVGAAAAGTRVAAGTTRVIAAARSRFADARADAATAGLEAAEAVTNGRLSPPAKIVTVLSDSMRTAISAPTRLSRSARIRPVNRPQPDTPTSAFGALATTVPSASRTTMSRMRSDTRPLASRSSWVPPSTTSWPPPRFSLIAAVSHGVATSSSIGPLDRRHHSATIASRTRPPSVAPPSTSLRRRGQRRIRQSKAQSRAIGEISRARGAACTSSSAEVGASRWHKCRWRLASSLRRASRLE